MKKPKMGKLHVDGIFRVLARMDWEWDNYIQPDMEEHWDRFKKAPLPLGHSYWNLFTEVCRIPEAAYFNGHVYGFLFTTQVITLGLLIWRW